MERPEEVVLLRGLLLIAADGGLHVFKPDDHVVFLRKFLQLCRKLQGMGDVHGKNPEKQADYKRERQIIGKPLHRAENPGMDQEIIRRARRRPDQGELRADNALYIPEIIAVIPKPHLHHPQRQDAGDIFRGGHRRPHQHDQKRRVPGRTAGQKPLARLGDQVEQAQPNAVQRQIRADAESGVNPLPFGVCRGQKAAEQQLGHPSADRAHKEQKTELQQYAHFLTLLHSLPPRRGPGPGIVAEHIPTGSRKAPAPHAPC